MGGAASMSAREGRGSGALRVEAVRLGLVDGGGWPEWVGGRSPSTTANDEPSANRWSIGLQAD